MSEQTMTQVAPADEQTTQAPPPVADRRINGLGNWDLRHALRRCLVDRLRGASNVYVATLAAGLEADLGRSERHLGIIRAAHAEVAAAMEALDKLW